MWHFVESFHKKSKQTDVGNQETVNVPSSPVNRLTRGEEGLTLRELYAFIKNV